MKKFVLKLDLQNDKEQQRRAMKTVSTLPGIDEISIDLKGKKLIVIGTVDPVSVVSKLRKRSWPADLISVGPAKEPEKKEEPKKEEPKKEGEPKKEAAAAVKEAGKEEVKKEEPKKEEAKKTEEPKKEEMVRVKLEPPPEMVLGAHHAFPYRPYRPYYPPPPPMNPYYNVHHSIEENPNACAIC